MTEAASERIDRTREWRVVRRKLLPYTVMVQPSTDPGTFAYATMQISVIERRGTELRERVTTTEPLYLHEHPELTLAFRVAISALAEIERAIEAKFLGPDDDN
ncbi:MAG: hypothetical protein QJR08_03655 [Bacillota bacterium]|nr:hypothetical protein [Bacillota bacterium]